MEENDAFALGCRVEGAAYGLDVTVDQHYPLELQIGVSSLDALLVQCLGAQPEAHHVIQDIQTVGMLDISAEGRCLAVEGIDDRSFAQDVIDELVESGHAGADAWNREDIVAALRALQGGLDRIVTMLTAKWERAAHTLTCACLDVDIRHCTAAWRIEVTGSGCAMQALKDACESPRDAAELVQSLSEGNTLAGWIRVDVYHDPHAPPDTRLVSGGRCVESLGSFGVYGSHAEVRQVAYDLAREAVGMVQPARPGSGETEATTVAARDAAPQANPARPAPGFEVIFSGTMVRALPDGRLAYADAQLCSAPGDGGVSLSASHYDSEAGMEIIEPTVHFGPRVCAAWRALRQWREDRMAEHFVAMDSSVLMSTPTTHECFYVEEFFAGPVRSLLDDGSWFQLIEGVVFEEKDKSVAVVATERFGIVELHLSGRMKHLGWSLEEFSRKNERPKADHTVEALFFGLPQALTDPQLGQRLVKAQARAKIAAAQRTRKALRSRGSSQLFG